MIVKDLHESLVLKEYPQKSEAKHRQPSNAMLQGYAAGWNTAIIIMNICLKDIHWRTKE